MSEAALAEPGEIKPTRSFNDKLESLQRQLAAKFPAAEFSRHRELSRDILYINYGRHCVRVEKRFVGYGFTDIADKLNLSLGPDCEFKEDLNLLTRHVAHFIASPREE